ncbi:MAG: hypothetical protein U5P41_03520 [Gammaproteobacteria bacterium]|nr:hypothetical protein [Gammaproteobacteria bacterium]
MRYLIIVLFLLSGCGMFGGKDEPAGRADSAVSEHDRDRAECEMQALEAISHGPDAEARIQRYTRLCMQSRGYPGGAETEVNVKLRN